MSTEERFMHSGIITTGQNYDCLMDKPALINPINIKISRNPQESVIVKDKKSGKDYPLHPGAMLGGIHYGFVLIIDTDKGQREVIYPTRNKIDAIGIEDSFLGDLKIFEHGKYYPWLFTYNGKLKKEAFDIFSSKQDQESVEANQGDLEHGITLQKKK